MVKFSGEILQLRVLVGGRSIQEYRHGAETFVEGRSGSEFELELTNLTDRTILVHPMIDGISAMTGKDARRDDSDHGYVLNPHAKSVIPGWRLDDKEVARFFFAGAGKSYAEKTGRGENKGVIACAVWEQKPVPAFTLTHNYYPPVNPWVNPYPPVTPWYGSGCRGSSTSSGGIIPESARYQDAGINFCADAGEQKTCGNLGTGFGEAVDHSVTHVCFEPATKDPCLVATVYYDDVAGLKKRGIKIHEKHAAPALPNPFPGSGCQPPRGWRRR